MILSRCMKYKYTIAFFLFLIAFCGYHIFRIYGFVFFPDEFGYWSYAAKACGYDWSHIVSIGSYYSYGYSLILFPIMYVCKNSVTAYRVAVGMNFVLIGLDYLLVWKLINREVTKTIIKKLLPLFIGIAMFYPPILFYAKTTMVETMLMSMFILITLLLADYLEHNNIFVLIALILSIVYIYFLHMRAIGVMIAAVLTLLIYFCCNSKKVRHILLTVLIAVIVLGAGLTIKEIVQRTIYADSTSLQVNDFGGQLVKLQYMLTKNGIVDFACGFAGKILYLGIASFGLFYFGVDYCVRQMIKCWKEKGEKTSRYIYIFLILAALGEILINTIYCIHPYSVDAVIYGRYDEFIMPIFMVLGILQLLKIEHRWKSVIGIVLTEIVFVTLVLFEIQRNEVTHMRGYFMVGMCYLENWISSEPKSFLYITCACGCGLMLVIVSLLCIGYKKKKIFLIGTVILIEFLLFNRASAIHIEESNLGAFRDYKMAQKIESLVRQDEDRNLIFLREYQTDIFISSEQFHLRDYDIEMLSTDLVDSGELWCQVEKQDILIVFYESTYVETLKEKYDYSLLNGRFYIFYNEV